MSDFYKGGNVKKILAILCKIFVPIFIGCFIGDLIGAITYTVSFHGDIHNIIQEAEKTKLEWTAFNPIFIYGEINKETALQTIKEIKILERDSAVNEIKISLWSLGGDVRSACAICRVMENCQKPITIESSQASSAAALILCSGTKGRRYVEGPEQEAVMIHPTATYYEDGSVSVKENYRRLLSHYTADKICDIFSTWIIAKNTGQNFLQTWKDKHKNGQVGTYFSAQEAIEYGFADSLTAL
ncbi:MAG: ATP-dependent Clp protease proteolytic subunit [Patescibacteria group bacterium]|nr:ATP-dependent Clp protease proteolytic subunit [Patescibacteria group bacterium]MDD5534377.1 ATP-dependent Clp protease proteolytic subunit [Patescibacteria group bacterium]